MVLVLIMGRPIIPIPTGMVVVGAGAAVGVTGMVAGDGVAAGAEDGVAVGMEVGTAAAGTGNPS